MTRAIALLATSALAATPSRADPPVGSPPVGSPPVVCRDGACATLTFDAYVAGAGADATTTAPSTASGRWRPLSDDAVIVETLAAKQPIEPDTDWSITPGAPRSDADRLRAVLRLLTAAGAAPARDELKAAKEEVEADATPGGDLPPRSSAPPGPDDRGFLDVVLVGHADAYHCTGILIAPDAVLTAAHCLPATEIAVAYRTDARFAHVHATDAVRHPMLDAAVLRLAQPLPLVVRARRRGQDHQPPAGTVRMVGYGVDTPRHPSSFGVKRRVDADVTGWGCDRSRARTAGCRPGAEMVLTAVGGGDTCFGDSGGPVLEAHDGAYRLLAITSRPTASGASMCGHGGIYVRVDVLDAWLTSTLEQPR